MKSHALKSATQRRAVRSPATPGRPERDQLLALQAQAGNRTVEERLRRSAGQPLDTPTRAEMEQVFDHDFGDVRVHYDENAAASAEPMTAKAYTVGTDVVFGAGRWSPGTRVGRRLLAHELAHVVQQSRGGPRPELDPTGQLEAGARNAADAALVGDGPVVVAGSASPGVAREVDEEQLKEYLEAPTTTTKESPPTAPDSMPGRPAGSPPAWFEPTALPPAGDVKVRRLAGLQSARPQARKSPRPGTLGDLQPTAEPATGRPKMREVTSDEQRFGIPSATDWERTRGATPTKSLQRMTQQALPEGSVDPAFPSLKVTGVAQADHIVPVDHIRRMPGFAQLGDSAQRDVLNLHDNFTALSPAANQSKGGRSFAEWTHSKTLGLPVDPAYRAQMMARDADLRVMLQERISMHLRAHLAAGKPPTGPTPSAPAAPQHVADALTDAFEPKRIRIAPMIRIDDSVVASSASPTPRGTPIPELSEGGPRIAPMIRVDDSVVASSERSTPTGMIDEEPVPTRPTRLQARAPQPSRPAGTRPAPPPSPAPSGGMTPKPPAPRPPIPKPPASKPRAPTTAAPPIGAGLLAKKPATVAHGTDQAVGALAKGNTVLNALLDAKARHQELVERGVDNTKAWQEAGGRAVLTLGANLKGGTVGSAVSAYNSYDRAIQSGQGRVAAAETALSTVGGAALASKAVKPSVAGLVVEGVNTGAQLVGAPEEVQLATAGAAEFVPSQIVARTGTAGLRSGLALAEAAGGDTKSVDRLVTDWKKGGGGPWLQGYTQMLDIGIDVGTGSRTFEQALNKAAAEGRTDAEGHETWSSKSGSKLGDSFYKLGENEKALRGEYSPTVQGLAQASRVGAEIVRGKSFTAAVKVAANAGKGGPFDRAGAAIERKATQLRDTANQASSRVAEQAATIKKAATDAVTGVAIGVRDQAVDIAKKYADEAIVAARASAARVQNAKDRVLKLFGG